MLIKIDGFENLYYLGNESSLNPLEELYRRKSTRSEARLWVVYMRKLDLYGIDRMVRANQARMLDAGLSLVELKLHGEAYRFACYVHELPLEVMNTVLLFEFRGHQGKTSAIPKEILVRAEAQARIARCVCEEYFGKGRYENDLS